VLFLKVIVRCAKENKQINPITAKFVICVKYEKVLKRMLEFGSWDVYVSLIHIKEKSTITIKTKNIKSVVEAKWLLESR
jgi:hypothetical protein